MIFHAQTLFFLSRKAAPPVDNAQYQLVPGVYVLGFF